MSYVITLETSLKQKNETLYNRLQQIKQKARPLMTFTSGGFPFFTSHDFLHSENVEENLNWLLPDNVKDELSGNEIFFLILSAWLHDWGMICQPDEDPQEVRNIHHLRTETNLENLHNELGLDIHEAFIVGRISRGHRKENLRDQLFDKKMFQSNIQIDVRFLAAALRLADECDLTYNRVPELIYYSLNPKGASEEHFKKHLSISGVGIYPESPYKITFNAIVTDPKGAETIEILKKKIQDEINNVKGILGERGIPVEIVEARVETRGFINKPIGFELDTENVTKILIGEGIYNRRDAAIRELLQNSVDACRIRAAFEEEITPEVKIYLEGNELVVEDNGTGMSYHEAKNFLSKKGNSFYKSEDFMKIKDKLHFSPISMWGLGVLSFFMIAKGMTIETKRQNSDACKFTVKSVQEGWRYDQSPRSDVGTEIRLELIDKWTQEELQKAVDFHVRDVEVQIKVGKDTVSPQRKEIFVNPELDIEDPELKKDIGKMSDFKCITELQNDDFKVRVYKKNYKKYDHLYFEPLVLFLNQGFKVALNRASELPYFTHSNRTITVIDFKKDVVDLFISRDRIRTDTEKYSKFIDKWNNILIELYENEILKATKMLTKEEQNDPFKVLEIENIMMNKYGLNDFVETYNDEADLEKLELKAVKDFVEEKLKFISIENGSLGVTNIGHLFKEKQKHIFVYYTRSFIEDYIREEARFLIDNVGVFPKDSIIILDKFANFRFSAGLFNLLSKTILKKHSISQYNIQLLVMKMNLPTVATELDDLLPNDSHFSIMPDSLRGLVACSKPLEIELTEAGREALKKIQTSGLSVENIFTFVPDFLGRIAETNRNNLLSRFINQNLIFSKSLYNYFNVNRNATLIFDKEDAFIGILLRNTETIKTDRVLREMVKNYFSILASYSLFPRTGIIDLIELRENEVINYLNIKNNLEPRNRRIGNLTKVIMYWSASQDLPLSAFPYAKLSGIKGLTKVRSEAFLESFNSFDFEAEV